MPDPDPKVTVPSDEEYIGELGFQICERLLERPPKSGELDLVIYRLLQVRDRTREATLARFDADLIEEQLRRTAEEARNVPR